MYNGSTFLSRIDEGGGLNAGFLGATTGEKPGIRKYELCFLNVLKSNYKRVRSVGRFLVQP